MNKIIYSLIFSTIIFSNSNAKSNFWSDWDNWSKESSKLMDKFVDNLKKTRKNIDEVFDKLKEDYFESDISNVNIFETKSGNEWGIEFKLPGFKKEDIKIKIDEDGFLHVNAETEIDEKTKRKNDKNKNYIYESKNFSARKFSQTIKLPENIEYMDQKNIKVNYDEKTGILEIKFPKKKEKTKQNKEIELELK
ncbi:Hsp20 family protein [Candidatus Dependentiae bacterium]|nr:Hsp20 family protein [Candidatus Dependentiae bacterium]